MSDANELNFQPISPADVETSCFKREILNSKPTNTPTESQTMSDIIELTVTNGQPTTTSLAIAERFGKRHADVLRAIEALDCSKEFTERNFALSAYRDSTGRALPMHHITKDGFMFLAMGFTGKEAAAWKERFIAAFNAMERQLLENAAAQQIPQPGGALFLSHTADIIVAADRTFRAGMRTGRQAGLTTAQSIRRANRLAYLKTGINMLEELQAIDHLENLEKQDETKTDDLDGFWFSFEGGSLPGGGCVPMLSNQLYQIYVYWCSRNNVEAKTSIKFTQEIKATGWFRHTRKRFVDSSGGTFGPLSFFIPTGPVFIDEGMSEAEWLGRSVENVDTALKNCKA